MAKERIVNVRFWRDNYILGLKPDARLLFLWAITNPSTELCGAFEAALSTIKIETALPGKRILEIFEKFHADGKMLYKDGWVIIRNFAKHQHGTSKNIKAGIARTLNDCPDWVKDTVSNGIGTVSHLDLDSVRQPIPKPRPKPEPSVNPLSADADRAGVLEPAEKKPADLVFEFWVEALGKGGCKFTAERRRKVEARMRSGYTIQQIQQAILGCKLSPHHRGENDRNTVYDDLEMICRNDTKLEQFIGYATSKPGTNGPRSQPVDEHAFQKMIESQELN